MSSESVSSAMAQRKVMFDLSGELLVIEGIDPTVFSIDCSSPRLNLKQLYEALFADITQPTEMIVQPSIQVSSNPTARGCFASVKRVIEGAVAEINAKLPDVIAKRKMLENSLTESLFADEDE